MSHVPPAITDAINAMEAELRNLETRGGLLRDTVAKLRDIYDVSPMVADRQASPPPVQFTPALSEQLQRTPARQVEAPAPKAQFETYQRAKRAPAANHQAQLVRVLKAAATLEQPFRMAQLHMKVSDINRDTLRDYVSQFVAAKALSKTGERAGTRYTVAANVDVSRLPPDSSPSPAPQAPPAAPAKAPKAARPSTINDKDLSIALMSMLASGASYEVKDLMKGLRGLYPDVTQDQTSTALETLVLARRVERIGVAGGAPRYRKRAA